MRIVPDGRPRLLCVDDEPDWLDTMSEFFAAQGFAVRTATNGLEAIVEVKRWTPRAVILDLFMPRLGGLGALDRIWRINPGVVTILIGGDPHALELAVKAGVSVAGSFTKPLDLRQILATLIGLGVTPMRALHVEAIPSADGGPPVRRRILVVDDDPDVGLVLAEYLRGRGFDVMLANNGEEALDQAPDFRPDFILLDIAMPGLGGLESLRRMKGLLPDTCVVMVSANDDVKIAQRTLAMGAADYIPKPVDFGYLDSVLALHSRLSQSRP